MTDAPIRDWSELCAFALALDLPNVTEAISWGHPNLKAHGKMWCWWSPLVDAAVFKGDAEEREILRAVDPETHPMHPHYARAGVILVAAGRIDRGWAEARLIRTWREMAPRRFLKAWDAAHGA